MDLAKLRIDFLRIRSSANGGRVFEIKGKNRAAKAAELAAELSKVVGPMGVTATCPARRVDLRVKGVCESAAWVSGWEVLSNFESLSDHVYLAFSFGAPRSSEGLPLGPAVLASSFRPGGA